MPQAYHTWMYFCLDTSDNHLAFIAAASGTAAHAEGAVTLQQGQSCCSHAARQPVCPMPSSLDMQYSLKESHFLQQIHCLAPATNRLSHQAARTVLLTLSLADGNPHVKPGVFHPPNI